MMCAMCCCWRATTITSTPRRIRRAYKYTPEERLFALLSIVRLAGTITGSLYLAQLFQTSLDARGGGPSVLRGGALPLVALSLPAALNVAALSCALPTHAEERGVGLLAGGAGGRTSERGRPPRGSKDSNDTETGLLHAWEAEHCSLS